MERNTEIENDAFISSSLDRIENKAFDVGYLTALNDACSFGLPGHYLVKLFEKLKERQNARNSNGS